MHKKFSDPYLKANSIFKKFSVIYNPLINAVVIKLELSEDLTIAPL